MKKYEAYVPVDLRVTLEARDEVVAGDKAGYVSDFFLKGSTPYRLNLPGVGAVVVELVPLEEDDDDTPDVFEVKAVETIGKLGQLPPQDVSQPFYGACLLPRQPEPAPEQINLGGELRGDEWGTAAKHYVEG